jgi:hypothetical protein
MRSPAAALARFRRDQRGSISVETVLIMPLLLWAFMALFVYWDAYRANNTHIKATYTVTDLFSREMAAVNNGYVAGLHDIYRYVTATDEASVLRVTSVIYRQPTDTYQVLWSRSTNTARAPMLTNATIAALRDNFPVMANDDTVLVLETWRDFTPPFNVGLDARTFYHISITRPRFLTPMPAPISS